MSQTAQPKLDLDALRAKAKKEFYFFAKGILGFDGINEHIHGPVCLALEDRVCRRKLFVLPRTWYKTTLCSIAYPIWLAINNPNIRILIVQNSATNSKKKLAVIRQLWEGNDMLRALFPELLPTRSSIWTADSLCLTRSKSFPEGTFEAAGTNTQVTSRHYDLVIEDDTVAPDLDELGNECLAPTDSDVQKAIGWHKTNVLPLLNNIESDEILIVGTRWYDQDLIRYIMDNEPQYKIITRACRENDEGQPDYRGHLTYSERFSEAVLNELETNMGPYMFGCLYMNTPVRTEDMAFKSKWFEYYDVSPQLSQLAVYTTIDPATDPKLSATGKVDFSVVMTCGKDMITGFIYVLDYFHGQVNPGVLASEIFNQVRKWRPVLVGYEDVAYQKSIEYWLKEMMRQEGLYFILEPLKLSRQKDAKDKRIAGLIPLFAAGVIKFKTWMKSLESELLKFPLGSNDDLPDCLSMQLTLWHMTRSLETYRQLRDEDPMLLDTALKELELRKKVTCSHSTISDPSRYPRMLDSMTFN